MKSSILIVVLCVAMAACSTAPQPAQEPPAQAAPPPPPPAAEQAQAAGTEYSAVSVSNSGASGGAPAANASTFQLERYIGIDSSKWPAPDHQASFSDLYTRIEFHSGSYRAGMTPSAASSTNTARDYTQESRGWLSRVLSTETDSVTTLASVQIANPELKVSVPLFSVTHASGSGLGNSWATDFTSSDVRSPLFRIGPNTTVTIDLSAKVSSDLKSQGTSLAVNAITQAVKIANPSAALLTTLSSSNVNSAATAIDTALSGLLSKDIAEDIQLGRLANSWQPGAQFTFYGCSPFVRSENQSANNVCGRNVDIDGDTDVEVGEWTLALTCPRLSAFDPRDICHSIGDAALTSNGTVLPDNLLAAKKEIAANISDSQVLEFPLSSQVTVSAFSQSQIWFTTFVTAIGHSAKPSDYGAFCAGAVGAYESSGLSQLDSEMALRALIRSLGQLSGARSQFKKGAGGDSCTPYAPPGDTGFE